MICRQGQIRLDTQFEEVAAKKAPQEGVAPTVERWTPNPTVAGSNPVALTFLSDHLYNIQINQRVFLTLLL